MLHVNDENFSNEIGSHQGPAVVDFWAEWCPPCKAFGPIFEEVGAANTGMKFAKCDVDQSNATAQQFGVRSIPTIIFLKDGKEVDRIVGALNKDAFEAKVKEHLA